MTGVRLYEKGAVTEKDRVGSQIDNHASSSGYLPYKQVSVLAHVTSTYVANTLTGFLAVGGLQTISGALAHTVALPSASLNPGALFSFRTLSAQAHVVTSSGTDNISSAPFAGGVAGTKLTLGASVGSSAVLYCDGLNWLLMAGSGSVA